MAGYLDHLKGRFRAFMALGARGRAKVLVHWALIVVAAMTGIAAFELAVEDGKIDSAVVGAFISVTCAAGAALLLEDR